MPPTKLTFDESGLTEMNDISNEGREHSVAVSTVDGIMRHVLSFNRNEEKT